MAPAQGWHAQIKRFDYFFFSVVAYSELLCRNTRPLLLSVVVLYLPLLHTTFVSPQTLPHRSASHPDTGGAQIYILKTMCAVPFAVKTQTEVREKRYGG